MKKNAVLFLMATALFCARGALVREDSRVVAQVNGEKIPAAHLLASIPPSGAADAQAWQEAKRKALERMIDQTLMVQLARKLDYQDSIFTLLEPQLGGLAQMQLGRHAEDQAVAAPADVARESLLHYTSVHLKLLEVPNYDTAQMISALLRNGTPFESLAVRFSVARTNSPDGDLGFMPEAALAPEWVAAVDRLKPGEATGPVLRRGFLDFVKYVGERMVPAESMNQPHAQLVSSAKRHKAVDYMRSLHDRVQYDERRLEHVTTNPDSVKPSDAESVVARLPGGSVIRVDSARALLKGLGDIPASARRPALTGTIENVVLERELVRLRLDKTPEYQDQLRLLTDRVLYQFCLGRQIDDKSQASDSEVNGYFHQHPELYPGKDLTSDVASEIRNKLRQPRREERIRALNAELRKSASITIDEKLLTSLMPRKTAK